MEEGRGLRRHARRADPAARLHELTLAPQTDEITDTPERQRVGGLRPCASPSCSVVVFGGGFCVACEKLLLAGERALPLRGKPLSTTQSVWRALLDALAAEGAEA